MRSLLVVLVGGLVFVGSAQATVIESTNPIFQSWTDQARVPTPQDAPLRVYGGLTSESPEGCDRPVMGCASRSGEWMFIATAPRMRFTFLHELGHIFDIRHGTDEMRVRFMEIVHRNTWIGNAEETFADIYAVCARRGLRPYVQARTAPARIHRQGCRLIRAASS